VKPETLNLKQKRTSTEAKLPLTFKYNYFYLSVFVIKS